MPEFEDTEWIQDVAFMVDIAAYLNDLNLKVQKSMKLGLNFLHELKHLKSNIERKFISLCNFEILDLFLITQKYPTKSRTMKFLD